MNQSFNKKKTWVCERSESGYNQNVRHKKTCQTAGFLSEHPGWRNVFEGFAVVFKHAFEDLTQFHAGSGVVHYG